MSRSRTPHDRFSRRRRGVWLRRWRWMLVGATLLAVTGAPGWVLLRSDVLAVQNVDVAGAGAVGVAGVSAAQVRAAGDVTTGTPLVRVDLDAVSSGVERLPGVASASVVRQWPHTLRVDIVERSPVAAVEVEGEWRALDATGAVFGAYQRPPVRLPRVRIEQVDPAQRDSAVAEAAAVLDSLEPAIAARLTSVEVSSMDDIVLVLHSGARVQWGSAADSARKAEVLTVLLRIPATAYDVTVPELPTTS